MTTNGRGGPIRRADVNWRLAVHLGALFGGVSWAMIGASWLAHTDGAAGAVASAGWVPVIVAAGAQLVLGAWTAAVARSIVVRSLGIALTVSATSGLCGIAGFALWAL
ncbi:hypothetical protein FHR72_004621 [Mycolicibacterium iranicum]|uniref:Uncharacterized protein n=1 Tax=Mycolicibacterium iranicum TaxID=912594 RepID=A0A839QEA7_MYCIR|nr:hypothetical protein [Mycolicibacterium iranicum]MBB2993114.1 hypothetical protein [Mycolicibacterium iranicum]